MQRAQQKSGEAVETSKRIRLRHGAFVVEILCPTPGDVEWLRENLRPAFDEDEDASPNVTLRCEIDAKSFAEMTGGAIDTLASSASREDVPCFSMDGYVAAFPPLAGKAPGVFDTDLRLLYLYDDPTATLSVVGPHYRTSLRIALLRLVRELAGGSFPRRSLLTVHASALALGDQGVLICGPKRAGKTTLLTHLLRRAGARYIANDRSLLHVAPDTVGYVAGIPTVVSLRADLWERLSLPASPHVGNWRARETLANSGRETTTPQAGASLSPAQYLALLGVTPCAQARLRAILFPEVNDEYDGIDIRPLDGSEAARRLLESSMPLHRTLFHDDVDEEAQRVDNARLCEQATTAHRAWALTLGRGAYAAEARLGDAVEKLLE